MLRKNKERFPSYLEMLFSSNLYTLLDLSISSSFASCSQPPRAGAHRARSRLFSPTAPPDLHSSKLNPKNWALASPRYYGGGQNPVLTSHHLDVWCRSPLQTPALRGTAASTLPPGVRCPFWMVLHRLRRLRCLRHPLGPQLEALQPPSRDLGNTEVKALKTKRRAHLRKNEEEGGALFPPPPVLL